MAEQITIHNISSTDEWKSFQDIAKKKGWQHSALLKDMIKFYIKKGEDEK